jgi:hypothetical protein
LILDELAAGLFNVKKYKDHAQKQLEMRELNEPAAIEKGKLKPRPVI